MDKRSRLHELYDDLISLKRAVRFVWLRKSLYMKYCAVAIVLSLIISFSIPKTYSTSVVLAPESQSSGVSAGIASLASMAGINMGGVTEDAYTVDLFPTIVASNDFILDLFDIRVRSSKREIDTTYATYLAKHQKRAWWSYPVMWVQMLIEKILPADAPVVPPVASNDEKETAEPHVRYISKSKQALCYKIQGNVFCVVDKMSGLIVVTVNDQDPEISAIVANATVGKLNKFIMDYRTSKARADYEYISILCDSSKKAYIEAQERYTDYARKHIDGFSPETKIKMTALENDVALAYSTYSSVASQQQMAQAKILEATPVYTVVESAYVPIIAQSPRKMFITIIFVVFACIFATLRLAYVIVKQKKWKGKA